MQAWHATRSSATGKRRGPTKTVFGTGRWLGDAGNSALLVALLMLATCDDLQTLRMVGGKRGVVGHGLVTQQHTKMRRLGRLPTGETLKSR